MSIRKIQQSFVGGEMSSVMYGRFDDQKYQQGLATCKNFICLPQGPVVNRPGFRFVREVKSSAKKVRLIPFIFSGEQTMVMEFGEKYIRFHTEGQTLLGSNGQPFEVTTPYLEDELFDIEYVQSMDIVTLVHPGHPPMELRRYSATDWRLSEIDFEPAVSAPTISSVTFSATGGDETEKTRYTYKYVVTSVVEVDGIIQESGASEPGSTEGNLYLENGYCTIKWGIVAGALRYRVYRSYRGLYSFIGETDEVEFIDDNYEADSGITPPIYETVFSQPGGISSVTVTSQGSGYMPEGRVDKVADFIYFMVDGKMGAYEYHLDLDDTDAAGTGIVDYEVVDMDGNGSGCTVKMNWYASYGHDHENRNGTFIEGFEILTPGTGYMTPRINLYKSGTKEVLGYVNLSVSPDGFDGVSLRVTDSTGSGAQLRPIVSSGKVVSVTVVSGGRNYTNPTITAIAKNGSGATFKANLGKSGDYPGAVCYFEQRRCFAGTRERPQMIWMTRSGTETDMSKTLPVQDDNRVKFRIASQEASRILHLIPMSKLMALTGTTEFCINSENADAVSALNIAVKAQSYIGASEVKPVVVNNTVVYAANRGGHIYELGYNWQANGFVTGDMSLRASHLFQSDRVIDMGRAKAPDPIIWMTTEHGRLLGLTYLPEQNIGAWHRHETTNGFFESVAVVPEGEEDIVYVVVRRNINGNVVRYIERMDERNFGSTLNAFFVDCGATYRGTATKTISGLNYLEGETVAILADGCVMPQQVVTNGKITLPNEAEVVHIGLPIVSDFQTLPVAVQLNDGSYGVGHMKNVNVVWARLYQSSSFFAGPTFATLTEIKQRKTEVYGLPPNYVDQEVELVAPPHWSDTGTVCIRQQNPLPMTIVSIGIELAE